jgi:hypothetical protein
LASLAREPKKNRFNKGVSGRGENGLTLEQKNRIRTLAGYLKGTDFSLYGLTD